MNGRKYMRSFVVGSVLGIVTSLLIVPKSSKNMTGIGKRFMNSVNKGLGVLKNS
ncbi:MAG TPA: hypothetical protein GX392_04525 [Clostridiales bacterium]|nr:hypothetical protein [Clostridiales bacterium]